MTRHSAENLAFEAWYETVTDRLPVEKVRLRPDIDPVALFTEVKGSCRAAFEAGAESRQREVDRLREAVAMVSTAMAQAALAKSMPEVREIRRRLKADISAWQDRG